MSLLPRSLPGLPALLCLALVGESCTEAPPAALAERPEARTSGEVLRIGAPQPIAVRHSGEASLGANAKPLSLVAADVDGDGFEDLISGYRLASGAGAISVQRANPAATTTVTPVAPLLVDAETIALPFAPELIVAARLGAEGRLELVAAQKGGRSLARMTVSTEGTLAVASLLELPGEVTALAAGALSDGERLLVGYGRDGSSSLRVYGSDDHGLWPLEEHPLPAPASAIAFGDLDGDLRADAVLLVGGEAQLLQGDGGLRSLGLGVKARALAVGAFVPVDGPALQLALLGEDGAVAIAASGQATPKRVTTPALPQGRGRAPEGDAQAPVLAARFEVIETVPGLAPANGGDLLFAGHLSGQPSEDVVLFSPELGELSVISHRAPTAADVGFVRAAVSTRPQPGAPVAALPMRLTSSAQKGLVVLDATATEPLAMAALAGSLTVNTPADSVDASPGDGTCADSLGRCSLRAAVMETNASVGPDTISVPAGTYTLTLAGANENLAATGDLDIRDALSIVGAGPGATIIQAGTSATNGIDKVFSVNPTFTQAFATSISGVTIRYGRNPSPWSGDGFGGALDWDASGSGTLTLTNCDLEDNQTLDGDGGALALTTSFSPSTGKVVLTNVNVRRNKAARSSATNIPVGGGVFAGYSVPLEVTGGEFTDNQALSGLGTDPKGQGGGVFLFDATTPQSFFGSAVFRGNQAGQIGGAIHSARGLRFDGTPVFDGNKALNGTGGAIFLDSTQQTTITKGTFTNNSAASLVSGVAASGGAIQVGTRATNQLSITLSRFAGNTAPSGSGLASTGGTVSAIRNWWSCSTSPTAAPCNTVSGGAVTSSPWLRLTHVASPSTIPLGGSSTLTASFLTDSSGAAVPLADLSLLIGLPIQFTNATLGNVSPASSTISPSGTANAGFLATAPGTGGVDAVVDGGPTRATITVTAPDLVVTKSHTGNFRQGQVGASYALVATNLGNSTTAGSVNVKDTLPSGLTATAISGTGWSCSLSLLECMRADALAAGASYPTITVTVDVAPNAPASVTNTATVSGGNEATTSNDSAADPTTIVQVADLVLAKSHAGNFRQGQSGTYQLVVSNVGPGPTLGAVTVGDVLPTGMTATALSGTGWTCTLGTASCTRTDALAAGASYPAITLNVDVAPNAPPSLTNTASVSGGGELVTTNDGASDPTTVDQVADLVISKSHSGNFRQGQSGATYTIRVSNLGPGPTNAAVSFVDTLPAGLSAPLVSKISGAGWTCTVSPLGCTRADILPAGASYPDVSLSVDVAANAPASVTNSVTVSGGGELVTSNDSASDPTAIDQVADLAIAKTHSGTFRQGQSDATYTIAVSNVGPGPTVGAVTVSDALPAGLTATALSGTGWSCTLSPLACTTSTVLAAGASYPAITLTVDVAANAPSVVTNTASVAGGGELNTANDSASDPTTLVQVADLVVTKSHAGDFRQGQTGAAYTLAVANTGPGATDAPVTLSDTLPTGLTATAISGAGWSCTLSPLECTRSDALASGATYPIVTVVVDVAAEAPALMTNTATVSGGGELATSNDSASDPTNVTQVADLVIAKSHTGTFAQGDSGTYTLDVSNIGSGPTVGTVTATEFLPPGVVGTGLSGPGWSCTIASLACTRSDVLAPGAAYPPITVTVYIPLNAPAQLTNRATVSGGGELVTSNDSAADPTDITQIADLAVTKSHVGAFHQGQQGATFTLSVENVGPGPTVGAVTVSDAAPSGLTPTAISGAGWSCTLSPLECSRSDALASGASYPDVLVTFAVAANAPSSVVNAATVSGGGERVTSNDSAQDTATIEAASDLAIAKSHTGDFRQGQQGASYQLAVSNLGLGPTYLPVTVSDALPSGLTATAISGAGWSCTLSPLECSRADALPASGTYPPITVLVDVAANAPSVVTNTAIVSGGGELNTANDSASDPTNVVAVADLAVAKRHVGDLRQGQTGASYTLSVSNVGPGPTLGTVVLSDALPGGLTATAISGAGWSCTVTPLQCTRSDVLASGGAFPDVTVTVDVAANAPASVTNTATVSGGGELVTSNDTAADPTNVLQVADLIVSKSHTGTLTQGQTGATYTIVVGNAGLGPTDAQVTVVDALPAGLSATALSGIGWSCDLATLTCTRADPLAAGTSYPELTLTVDIAPTAATSITNTVTVSGGGELDTSNDSASDVASVTEVSDLTVTKRHAGDFRQGQTGASYMLTVANAGPGTTLGEVTLVDALPAELTATAIAGPGWSCTLATLSCTRADPLAAGMSYPDVTVTVDVAGNAPASVTNTATVSGGGELDLSNDSASDPTTVVAVADLTLMKSHVGEFVVGQVGATYTLTVNNEGGGPTVGAVSVVDQLPEGLIATGLAGDGWSCTLPTLTCTRSDALAPGASYPAITVTVDVAGRVGEITNTATVSGGGELVTTNDGATDPTGIVAAPARGCGCGASGSEANSALAALGLAFLWQARRRKQTSKNLLETR